MKNILKTTALITGMIASGTLMAATDGTLGATSTGTLDISVDVEDLVRISGLSDILLTFDATGTGDVVGSSTACVYRNGAGTYSVNATGDGAASAFTIQNAAPTPTVIGYTVGWDDAVTGTAIAAVSSGTALTGQTGANTVSDDCSAGGGANAFVEVTVPRTSLVAAPAGTYNGTLTLEVAPE
mgnify:CR=1 FL=1|tara:strand:- start:198268 stop:198816 length:549 start_codon:yes stop_codon:yes gene_type:complete